MNGGDRNHKRFPLNGRISFSVRRKTANRGNGHWLGVNDTEETCIPISYIA